MSREGSYAPKSPDLSSFYATPAPAQPSQPAYQQPPQRPQHQLFLSPQPYYQPPPQYAQPYFPAPQHLHSPPPPLSYHPQQQQPPYGVAQPHQPPFLPSYDGPVYPPYSGYQGFVYQQPSPQPQTQTQPPLPPLFQPSLSTQTGQLPVGTTSAMPPRKAAVAAAAALAGSSAEPPSAAAAAGAPDIKSVIAPSLVKTKFPTARIKRIMQADEEVGKVSQQTPIAVGKALELFMIALVTRSADVARSKNSKRVTAPMLKQVVETDDQWDFLRDIVKKVDPDDKHARAGAGANASAPASRNSVPDTGKAKADSDTEDEQPRKRGRPGRKKKA